MQLAPSQRHAILYELISIYIFIENRRAFEHLAVYVTHADESYTLCYAGFLPYLSVDKLGKDRG